jgi:hypothetical protein
MEILYLGIAVFLWFCGVAVVDNGFPKIIINRNNKCRCKECTKNKQFK